MLWTTDLLILLSTIALGGVVATAAALVALHVPPTGLSPLRDPVSAYGISRHNALYRAQTLGTAVAAAALAGALQAASIVSATPAVATLVVLAAVRGIIGWVPMDSHGSRPTTTGRIHNLLPFGAFAAASVGGFMVGIAFSTTAGLSEASTVSTTLAWLMTAAGALTILASALAVLRGIFGLAERLIYLGMLAWLTHSAVTLIQNG